MTTADTTHSRVYRVLGPIGLEIDGAEIEIGGRHVRTVLAALVTAEGRWLSIDRLVALLWGQSAPSSARSQVHNLISRLRRMLAAGPAGPLVAGPGGYRLAVNPGESDLAMFVELVAGARQAVDGDPARASGLLAAARARWHGPVLAGASEQLVQAERPRLNELYLAATREWIRTDLALGRHQQLVAPLRDLVISEPLHEEFRAALMTALDGCGRRAEALACFREARAALVGVLGIEPGPVLQQLHRQLLGGEADSGTVRVPAPRSAPEVAPHLLPPPVPHFTGRDREMSYLRRLLDRPDPDGVTVIALSGQRGVGKTALAVQAIRTMRTLPPDGELFMDLRGTCAGPVTSRGAIVRLLAALGFDRADLPEHADDLADRYRSALATRSLTIVLDDAADESLVRNLLPTGPGSIVLVTSRRSLALEVDRMIELDALSPTEAALLTRRVGAAHGACVSEEVAAGIAARSKGLPTAVRTAAARLATALPVAI